MNVRQITAEARNEVEENGKDWSDMVDFKFRYKITYIDGQTYDWKHILNVQVTEEEYKSIIQGVLQGIEIKDNPKIPDVISRMTETVEYVDRWTSINGAIRTGPLKNPRKEYQSRDVDGLFCWSDIYQLLPCLRKRSFYWPYSLCSPRLYADFVRRQYNRWINDKPLNRL